MDITLTKWGNSLGIRLPAFITKKWNLHNGDKLHIELSDNKIIIEPFELDNREIIKQALANFKADDIEIIEINELNSEKWYA